jgi:hypothetical protein
MSKVITSKKLHKYPENRLKLEILALKNYRIDTGDFTLLDPNDNELCLCGFEKYYENKNRSS